LLYPQISSVSIQLTLAGEPTCASYWWVAQGSRVWGCICSWWLRNDNSKKSYGMFMLLIFKHVTCTRYPHLGLTLVFSRITIHCLFFQFQVTPVSSLFWKKTIMCISLTFHNLCIICSTNISGIFTHEMNLLEMC
jgi:hypothetical protein